MTRKIFILLISIGMFGVSIAQNNPCIDRVIINVPMDNTSASDTMYCKIISTDQSNIIIDNGYSVTSLPLTHIADTVRCIRPMSNYEIYRFQGVNFVEFDIQAQRQTVGNYLMKAANSAYWATALSLVGTGTGLAGGFLVDSQNGKVACYTIAGISAGAAIFFAVRSWDFVYRAGKIIDINGSTSLHLSGKEGVGLSLRF